MKYRDMNSPPTQRERADERQVVNGAGGYVYEVGKADRLRRFLVLGTEGGTFYMKQAALTKENAQFLLAYAVEDPTAYWEVLQEANDKNIAPRHSTLLFALAVLHSNTPAPTSNGTGKFRKDGSEIKDYVLHPVDVAIKEGFTGFVRTATHLFEFIDYATMFRGWGLGLRTLITNWYLTKSPDRLAYQVVKYRERGGWSHRDVLRKVRPTRPADERLRSVIDYAVNGWPKDGNGTGLSVIDQFEAIKVGGITAKGADALPWEAMPTEALTDPNTWFSLLQGGRLPFTAMLRNLGRMTSIGVFNRTGAVQMVLRTLDDDEAIRNARIHPFNALTALKTYKSGTGFRGSLSWTPNTAIIDALDGLFYKAFGNVEPTGRGTLIALDVSASMGAALMNSNVTAYEGSAAMALATIAADPHTTDTVAFTQDGWSMGGRSRLGGWGSGITEMNISPRQRLDDVIRSMKDLRMGGTDCALPILWAHTDKRAYDAFVVITDNETWAGAVQPMEALRQYRKDINPGARLIVVGMTSTGFTIADPQDAGTLDVVGFDASAPSLISNFIAGRF